MSSTFFIYFFNKYFSKYLKCCIFLHFLKIIKGLGRAEVGGIHGSGLGRGGDQEEATVQGEAEGQQEQGEGEAEGDGSHSGLLSYGAFGLIIPQNTGNGGNVG